MLICEKRKKGTDKQEKTRRDNHRTVLCSKEENSVDNQARKLIHRLSIDHAQKYVSSLSAWRPSKLAAG